MNAKTANLKTEKRARRHGRVRAKVSGIALRPRLSVFRSNKYIYAQLIDDAKSVTLVAADSRELGAAKAGKPAAVSGKRPEDVGFTKVPEAFRVGALLAEKATAKKIKKISFDRGGYRYAGRVKALAEGARDGGLEF